MGVVAAIKKEKQVQQESATDAFVEIKKTARLWTGREVYGITSGLFVFSKCAFHFQLQLLNAGCWSVLLVILC